jgi:hypothetical protein
VMEATYGSPSCRRSFNKDVKGILVSLIEEGAKEGPVYVFSYHDDGRYKVKGGGTYGIPYRALCPKGIENLLVAGKAVSADRGAYQRFLMQNMVSGQQPVWPRLSVRKTTLRPGCWKPTSPNSSASWSHRVQFLREPTDANAGACRGGLPAAPTPRRRFEYAAMSL